MVCFDDCPILSTPYCLLMYTLLFANNCGLFVVAAKQNNCLYRDLTEPVKSVDLAKPAESTSDLTQAVKSVDQAKLAESTCSLAKAVKSASSDVIDAVGGPGRGSRQQGVLLACENNRVEY